MWCLNHPITENTPREPSVQLRKIENIILQKTHPIPIFQRAAAIFPQQFQLPQPQLLHSLLPLLRLPKPSRRQQALEPRVDGHGIQVRGTS